MGARVTSAFEMLEDLRLYPRDGTRKRPLVRTGKVLENAACEGET